MPQFLVVDGELNLRDLVNSATYTFAPGSHIIMLPNSKISVRKKILISGTVIEGCSATWGEIDVLNNGEVTIMDSEVRDACIGLNLNNGSKLQAVRNLFSNNSHGIQAVNSSFTLLGEGIAHNLFESPANNVSCIIGPSGAEPVRGIFLDNTSFTKIGNTNGVDGPNIFSTPIGIETKNTNFEVEDSRFENRPASSTYYAIRMAGTGATFTATIKGLGLTTGNEMVFNYWNGVRIQNYNLTLTDALFDQTQVGVEYINSSRNVSVDINNNKFDNLWGVGVSFNQSRFLTVNVSNNSFVDRSTDISNTARFGIKWQSSIMTSTPHALFKENTFSDDLKIDPSGFSTFDFAGINIANSTSYIDIIGNTFYQNYASATNQHVFTGIRSLSSQHIKVEDNAAIGANLAAATDALAGYYFYESGNNTFMCNRAEKMTQGFYFYGPLCDQTDYQHSRMENNLTGMLLGSANTIIGKQSKKENRWVGSLPSGGTAEAHFDFGINPVNPFALLMSEFQINDPNLASDYWANPRMPALGWFNFNSALPIFEECAKKGPDPDDDGSKSRAQQAAISGDFPNYRGYEATGWEMNLMAFGSLTEHPELLQEGTPDLAFYQVHENDNIARLWHAYADWNRLQQTNSETESALYANQSASDAAIATLKEMNDGSDFSDETLASIAGIEADIKSLAEGNEALHTSYVAETTTRVEQLQNDLESIEASNIWERNLKTVLQLRAEKLLNQSDDWSNEQREALQQIADQCRYEGLARCPSLRIAARAVKSRS